MVIKNFEKLAVTDGRRAALGIIEVGLSAVQPDKVLVDWELKPGNWERIFLLGFGKGSAGVAKILEEKIGDKLTAGWVIDLVGAEFKKIKFTLGTHPLPSEINVNFTKEVLKELSGLNKRDLVIVIVCGGGSALFTDPTVPLGQLINMNKELLKSGKTISEMNAERKKLDRVKGGGLAQSLAPAKVVGLIFSDVPGNDLATIASGPTVGSNAENILMVSNLTALSAMKRKAEEVGYSAEIVTDSLEGEAREVGRELVTRIRNKSVDLYGGETTVTIKGNGEGGRNQELVLAALPNLSDHEIIISIGTDGWDNSPVAGAIGDHETISKLEGLKVNPMEFLDNNDSYNFFQKVGDFIETGRLPMNVSDLMMVLHC